MLQRCLWVVVIVCGLATPFAADTQRPAPVKVWADKSTDVSGRVSRDGRILPFVDWSTYGLSVRDLASGEVKVLVPGKGPPSYPVTPTPSHDGKQIAYVLGDALHIVPTGGGPSKVVYQYPQLNVGDWTADAAALVVTKIVDAGRWEIGIVDIAKGTYRRLGGEGRGITVSASTSASRPFVVYDQWIADAPSRSELRILSLKDGTSSVLLTGGDDFSPRWSPKDDAVIFVSNRNDRKAIWSIAVREGRAAGAPRLLHELNEDLRLMAVTTDGTAYFYGFGAPLMTYVARVTWPDGDVSKPTAIATPQFFGARRAIFSPDGKQLSTVFRTALGGVRPGWQMPVITELATGRQWTFPSELTIRDEVGWMPDGQALIAINDEAASGATAGPPYTFWRLSLADRSMTRVGQARGSGIVRLAGITDRDLVYKRTAATTSYIEAFDFKTGSTRELYRSTEVISDASLSPDGKQLALSLPRGTVTDYYLLRVGETTPTKLALSNFRANARAQATWVATQDALILNGTLGNEQGIWRVPLNGEAPQRLKLNIEGFYESRLSPDGQTIAYTIQPLIRRELWMLPDAVAPADRRGALSVSR